MHSIAPCWHQAASSMQLQQTRQLLPPSSSTAWPAQRPQQQQQCAAAALSRRSSSSSAAAAACSRATPCSSLVHSRKQQRRSRGSSNSRALSSSSALSSKSEPSSLQTSYEESAAAASVSTSAAADGEDYGYMQEYAALKAQLLDNTRKGGGAIGAYLFFTVNGTAALLAMVGAGASYAYLSWLCRDVDAVRPTDTVPIWEANKIKSPWLRRAAKLTAAYRKALQPRLLVPVGLGVLIGAYDRVTGDSLPLLYSGCLLLGFLSYKLALVTKLVSDLAPKSFMGEAERPKVERIEDELDQWGRPKKRLSNPIDVMPDDMQAKAYEQLEEQMAKEERRMQD